MSRAATFPLRNFYQNQGVAELYMVYGRSGCGKLGLSVARSHASGSERDQLSRRILTTAGVLLPILAKHIEVCGRSKLVVDALSSLRTIEKVLATTSNLPHRLQQVRARFIFGISASLIASDAGLSVETVMSYRKRLYQRLGVASHRELIIWYLGVYDEAVSITGSDLFAP
ncbi:LuxR C-terminal-related transcriptional regulator [Sphingomonas sp. TX0522]|uniref:LuxR C-terminal-related transcriptional regulator n=1 Tax=Sphingomonas sp. TX0522 TaxID=2479205 RepID=UPI0018DF0D5D|nr:LuxR C-terminal-related transcriptional regulator [Sphingomonas sp. TX0522]